VTTGEKVGSFWLITKGLKPKDRVLIEGVQKVKPGMVVKPKLVTMGPISPPLAPEKAIAESSADEVSDGESLESTAKPAPEVAGKPGVTKPAPGPTPAEAPKAPTPAPSPA